MKDLAFDHWDDLILMVVQENDKQLEKWGYQDVHQYAWTTWLTEEVGELAAAIGDQIERGNATDGEIAIEAIQVATLALKIAEMHLYRSQSQSLLVDPEPWEVKKAIEEARPGETIEIEETLRPYPQMDLPDTPPDWDKIRRDCDEYITGSCAAKSINGGPLNSPCTYPKDCPKTHHPRFKPNQEYWRDCKHSQECNECDEWLCVHPTIERTKIRQRCRTVRRQSKCPEGIK